MAKEKPKKKEGGASVIKQQIDNLSRREKVMLYVLAVILILAGGVVLMIKPALATHDEVDSNLIAAQQQQEEIEMIISQMPAYEANISECNEDIKSMKPKFEKLSANEDVDSLLTGMVIGSGLTPSSLKIAENPNETEEATPETQAAESAQTDEGTSEENTSEEGTDGAAADETTTADGTINEQGTADAAAPEPANYNNDFISKTTVELQVKGSKIGFNRLLDRIRNAKGVVLESFVLTDTKIDDGGLADIVSNTISTSDKKRVKNYDYAAQLGIIVYQRTAD